MVGAIDFVCIKNLLLDVGCVRLPNSFSDDDVEDIIRSFHELSTVVHDVELVVLPDCYYLYIDTRFNAERFRSMLTIELYGMEQKVRFAENALTNVNAYLKSPLKS